MAAASQSAADWTVVSPWASQLTASNAVSAIGSVVHVAATGSGSPEPPAGPPASSGGMSVHALKSSELHACAAASCVLHS